MPFMKQIEKRFSVVKIWRDYVCGIFVTCLYCSKQLSAVPDSQMAEYMQSIVWKNMDARHNQPGLYFSGSINTDCVFPAGWASQKDDKIDQ